MPRKPRFYLPGVRAHIVQRCNGCQAVFFDSADYIPISTGSRMGLPNMGCDLHAYVLMTNHVQFLMTPLARDSIGGTIQFTWRRVLTARRGDMRIVSYFVRHWSRSRCIRYARLYRPCTPLGNDGFREQVENALKCRVGLARRGARV